MKSRSVKTKYHKPESVKKLENLAFKAKKEAYPNFPYPVQPKYRDDSSNELTRCVIDYIRLRGFQAERVNTIGQQIQIGNKKRWVKGSSQTGSADIHATIQGRSVKIEIKCAASGDNLLRDEQKDYQKQIEAAGGVYLVVRCFDDFYNWFNRKGEYNGKR